MTKTKNSSTDKLIGLKRTKTTAIKTDHAIKKTIKESSLSDLKKVKMGNCKKVNRSSN